MHSIHFPSANQDVCEAISLPLQTLLDLSSREHIVLTSQMLKIVVYPYSTLACCVFPFVLLLLAHSDSANNKVQKKIQIVTLLSIKSFRSSRSPIFTRDFTVPRGISKCLTTSCCVYPLKIYQFDNAPVFFFKSIYRRLDSPMCSGFCSTLHSSWSYTEKSTSWIFWRLLKAADFLVSSAVRRVMLSNQVNKVPLFSSKEAAFFHIFTKASCNTSSAKHLRFYDLSPQFQTGLHHICHK